MNNNTTAFLIRAICLLLFHVITTTPPIGGRMEDNKMACFLVPTAEAVVTTIVSKKAKGAVSTAEGAARHPFLKRINWLNNMLWGGSALLAFEHVWHGEVTPWFPFLTNAANPADAVEMLGEMATSGVAMALLVTTVWVAMATAANVIEKRELKPAPAKRSR